MHPSVIIKIQLIGRGRFIDAIEAAFRRHRFAPRIVLIFDPFPPCNACRRDLIVESHCGRRQIVKECLELCMEERQPMLKALMFATGADRLIEWIVGTCRAEFQAVVLSETCDRRVIENNL